MSAIVWKVQQSRRSVAIVCLSLVLVVVLLIVRWHRPRHNPVLDHPVIRPFQPPLFSKIGNMGSSQGKPFSFPAQNGPCFVNKEGQPSVALPTCGCYLQQTYLDLEFNCLPAIDVDMDMALDDIREIYYRHTLRKHVECDIHQRFGNKEDGGWDVCSAGVFQIRKPCIIYSFGINNDWSFDEAISSTVGCKVYAFDPSIGKDDHKHSENIWFYNRGLGGKTEVLPRGWSMKTLKDIMQEMGHLNETIDYLKFDIEFSEWLTLDKMLQDGILKNIKQIAFEVHTWVDNKKSYIYFQRLLQALENFGFQRWYIMNLDWQCFAATEGKKRFCPQINMAFINTNFLR